PVDPARRQMFWVFFDETFFHDGRKTDRDRVVIPARRRFFDLRDEFFWRELHPGIEFPGVAVRDHQLHVRPADIDNEDLLLHRDDDARELLAKPELLEEAALLRLCRGRGRRPAFDDLQREK